ncbi:MAG: glycosyltransferase [Pseudolabrys sp.]
MAELYLNIGCGRHPLPGFLNIDIETGSDMQHDVTQGLPFDDASVNGVFSEHFFEHISQSQGLEFLRECRRVLKPGGVLRIAMPDLDELVRRYCDADWRGDGEMFQAGYAWIDNRCEMLNLAMREWGHQWIYNEEELRRAATFAGLRVRGRGDIGQSEEPKCRGLAYRGSSRLIMEFERETIAVPPRPLVSLLIPAYNPRFYAQALASALSQIYPNLELIICDDCPSDEIERITWELAQGDQRVRYFRNEVQQGGMGNYIRCLEKAKGELIKFLNDDDVLGNDCIDKMVVAFEREPTARLVTSRRSCIDVDGRILPDIDATRPLVEVDSVIKGESLAAAILALGLNPVGEPSTTMFRAQDARSVLPHPISFGGVPVPGVGDVALWLNLMSRGDVVYLSEPLSQFRLHSEQRQRDPEIREVVQKSWAQLRYHGCRLGLFAEGRAVAIKQRGLGSTHWYERKIETIYPVLQPYQSDVRKIAGEIGECHDEGYQRWLATHTLDLIDGELLAERMMRRWERHPTFHVIVPLRAGEERLLADTIDSLADQLYQQWGLTVIADFSSPDATFEQQPNLEWITIPPGASVITAVNEAVVETGADWIGMIPAGIRLTPQLLISCGDYINIRPSWRFIYTDSDTIDVHGKRSDPEFRPDFNLDLLRSMPYMGALCLVRRDALAACGGLANLSGAENYDVALKVLEQFGETAIGHISDILYHMPVSAVRRFDPDRGQMALEAHLDRCGVQAVVGRVFLIVIFVVV